MLRGKRRHGLSTTAGFGAAWAVAGWFAWASSAQAYKVQLAANGADVRWHGSSVTLQVSPELEAYFADLPTFDLVTDAASAWAGLEGVPELRIGPGEPEALGFHGKTTNGVYVVEDWKLWPEALAVTVVTFKSETGALVDADIQVNPHFRFDWLPPDGGARDRYDLLAVLTHEMGHVLGLGDASDQPGATMWPIVLPGDTYQRDIATDDEAGAESIYAETAWSASLGGGGCGGASVLRPLSTRVEASRAPWIALSGVFVLWIWLRAGRSRSKQRHAIMLGGALLFGGFVPPPKSSPREPPAARDAALDAPLARESPAAQRRLAAFVKGAERLIKGRAKTRALRHAGMIWTHVRVQGALGSAEFDAPGGELDGLTQIVSGRTPPREGETLVVALRKRGSHGWAHFQDGVVYGGSLGEGPPLEWE